MKPATKIGAAAAAACGVALLLGSGAAAQARMRGPGQGRLYDPKTVETVRGEVLAVERVSQGRGRGYGVHLSLKTDKETIPVHLGPMWFLEKQKLQVKAHDQVEVTGSRVELGGKPVLIAAEIKRGDATLELRDQAGIPRWSGRRGRGS
ncbi:MAG TPA: DNA-binding protein [Candidatus Binatia bacterium]|nr:DNA-binding protein [Candidatus Binatia bacterium]